MKISAKYVWKFPLLGKFSHGTSVVLRLLEAKATCEFTDLGRMVVTATVPMYRLLKPLNIYSRFALNHLSFSANMSEKNAVVLLSEGSEEMELIISVDVLRRAGVSQKE